MTSDESKPEPPVMPTADEATAAGENRVDAPGVVRAAFWVWVAAGVAGVIGSVLFFALRSRLIAETLKQRPELSQAELERTATGLSWWLLLGSIMFLGFFVLLAHKARGGTRKARTLLVTVGVFAAMFQYTIGRVGILGLVSALLIVVALGMLYMPKSRAFFKVSDER
ncbi:hypothetical protein [Alloactinosynnema sp. L-07]|uniref:hypothetical protein n=1 Tax=Alloactinosynnema sp. L-07 TaxID=1653480 RepID=UPI00065EFDF6|nr:hypothetical protein [Alloactinosynnema sp. L-07]CRK60196.1 hypothetical protein [Alloactinosynnema sp. L-07]